jgi:hypothetical protein
VKEGRESVFLLVEQKLKIESTGGKTEKVVFVEWAIL